MTYNANTGTGTAPSDANAYAASSHATALGKGSLTKSDYTFAGWNTAANGSGTSYAPGDLITISANVTLYAQWTAVGANTRATVSFNTLGGNSVAPVTVDVGSAISLTTPTRTGYSFTGWFTAASGGTLVNRNYVVTYSVTLFAHWVVLSNPNTLSAVIYPFVIDRTYLTPAMIRDIAAFAAKVVRYHFTKVSVIGLADSTGNRAANLALGLGRAQAVKAQLLSDIRALAPSMKMTFTVISRGDTVQPGSNATVAGRAYNRQVAITAKP